MFERVDLLLRSKDEAFRWIARLRFYLRRASSDGTEAHNHAHERYRRALISGFTSALARGVSVITLLVSIPLTLDYLGVERFGVWMTLTSFGALMAFMDFGLGNGLMNVVAAADAQRDSARVRTCVSTTLALLSGIAIIIILAYVAFGSLIPWQRIFAVPAGSGVGEEIETAMAVFAVCLALGIPATVVQRVQFALQMGYMASLWQLASSVISLGALVAVIAVKGTLAWLAIAAFGVPVLVNIVNSIVFWLHVRRDERPSFRLLQWEQIPYTLRVGMLFFVLQLASSVAFASDNLIIAQVLGQPAVAQYAIVARLFEAPIILLSMFVTPLWPAYAEASARGDTSWVRQTLLRSMQATVVIMIIGIGLLIVASKSIIELWVGSAAGYSFVLVLAYGAWMIFKGVGSTLATFLNGMNFLRSQAILAVMFAAASIVAKLELARRVGLVGVPIALLLTYVVVVLLPCGVMSKKAVEQR